MRRLDETPLDPEIAAALEAIDATMAGDPVDPAYAELAELALLLTAERPRPDATFSGALDERVERRFAPKQEAGGQKRRKPRRWWLWTPATGLAVALVVAVVIVLGDHSSINSASSFSSGSRATAAVPVAPKIPATRHRAPSSATSLSSAAAPPLNAERLQPPANGRKVIQSAQLTLNTNSNRVDDVAQEVFVVVGQVHGIVSSSEVTATGGPGGYAQFQLRIPSGSISQAMAALSSLRYARVASRTDTTQDVNDQYQADVRRLADDRAVRASLLQQLANATTQGQIDSLTARIHDIDAAISSDQATLNGLNNQINYSQVTVTINGGGTPVPVHPGAGGGFTLHEAVHDAGRVLTVATGVALIGLAALAPIALVCALAWWIAAAIRRRRREQALDVV
jgi:hypothetical protein